VLLAADTKVGARVVAGGDPCAHTPRGTIASLSEYAPVAIVSFDCGCRAYVPLRRLEREDRRERPCEAPGCRRTEWPAGSGTCVKHKSAAVVTAAAMSTARERVVREQPFDSKARPGMAGTPARSPRTGRADIDGRGTKAADAPLNRPASAPPPRGEQAAGRMAGQGSGVPRPAPAMAGSAARRGNGSSPAKQSAPAVVSMSKARRKRLARALGYGRARGRVGRPERWTRLRCIQAAHRWQAREGRWPIHSDWWRAGYGHPSNSTIKRLFGGWLEFAAAAGFDSRHRREWTCEQAIEALQRYAREEGRSPSTAALGASATRPDYAPAACTLSKLFGSFPAALAAAGLPPNPVGRPRRKQPTKAAA
jgi:hypothetical protein